MEEKKTGNQTNQQTNKLKSKQVMITLAVIAVVCLVVFGLTKSFERKMVKVARHYADGIRSAQQIEVDDNETNK